MISRQRAESLCKDLSAALDAALAEDEGSTAVMSAVVRFRDSLVLGLSESGGATLDLHMRMSLFVHNGRTLADASIRGRSVITFLRRIGRGGFRFGGTATADSITKLISAARRVASGEVDATSNAFKSELDALEGIETIPPLDDVRWDIVNDAATRTAYTAAGLDIAHAEPTRMEVATVVEEAVDAAGDGHSVDIDVARTASETVLDATESGFGDLMQLAERPEFDVFTVQHSLRVALLASYVAGRIGVSREANIEITAAAMYHDVGKGRIPESILYKPGRLDEDERRTMASHPALGAEILLESQNKSPYALGAAWGHHLRFDGKGYPQRRPWFQTSRTTSLIQVCDVFEALTSRRPYKAPYSPARAFQILYSDPGAFDPGLLAAFTRALGLYPPGRFVALSNGKLGRVARVGAKLDRPEVRTFPDGEIVDLTAPEHNGLSVIELIEEPEFLRRLRDTPEPESPLPRGPIEDDVPPYGPRDDEYVGLTYSDEPDDPCGHGHDCRLC